MSIKSSDMANLRKEILAQQEKSQTPSGFDDNALFPFWRMDAGETATIRFLPDKNESNPFFWAERVIMKFPYAGIKHADGTITNTEENVVVQLPCIEAFEGAGKCPVQQVLRGWFKSGDPEQEADGRRYWRKTNYIYQGLVVDMPASMSNNKDIVTPENPVRRFFINKTLHAQIKAALADVDIVNNPSDPVNGLDFKITKTQQGEYPNYSTSSWARKERELTADELAGVGEYGLKDLSDFLPKKPDARQIEVIQEMFEASHNGEYYDVARWANYYRPYQVQAPDISSIAPGKANGSARATLETDADTGGIVGTASFATETRSHAGEAATAEAIIASVKR